MVPSIAQGELSVIGSHYFWNVSHLRSMFYTLLQNTEEMCTTMTCTYVMEGENNYKVKLK